MITGMIMDYSAITRDEIIESHKEDAEAKWYGETNFKEKKAACKTQNIYILLAFLLITIALLIADKISRKTKKIYYHFMVQITN